MFERGVGGRLLYLFDFGKNALAGYEVFELYIIFILEEIGIELPTRGRPLRLLCVHFQKGHIHVNK